MIDILTAAVASPFLVTFLLLLSQGDPTKLRGFYNYMHPPGNPNWREYYFGSNYQRLSEIKAKYDGTNVFGNPMQVEPAIPDISTICENDDSFRLIAKNGMTRDCKWVNKKPRIRCDLKGVDNVTTTCEACPLACNPACAR